MITTRFYYTLNEIQDTSKLVYNFKTLFDFWSVSYAEGTNTVELYNHIDEKYGDEFIVFIDVDHFEFEAISKPTVAEIKADADYLAAVIKQLKKIKGYLDDTQFRYDTLISQYTAQEDNLLKKIESTSTVQFNDTPQTTTSGLDSDNYATTYTVNKAGTEGGTVMQRLDEIRAAWQSIYGEWEHDFARHFIIY